jgi:HEXXH motif-containing protein
MSKGRIQTTKALAPPEDLTVPEPGSTTARDVLSLAIGRAMREARAVFRGHPVLDRLEPGALASLVRRARVGVLVRAMRSSGGDALRTELLATMLAELAPDGPPGDAVAIDGGIVLALADNNPLAMHEAHPDKHGNAIDFGGRPTSEWVASLREALDLVRSHLPDLRAEMDLYVQQIVPVGFFADRHLSASYREAIGTLYLSLHPSLLTMVEALVHEFQHNKLNALLESDDVLENAHEPLYRSPVRPDARPLHGVLLAVHAFVPVALLYERMIAAGDSRASEGRLRDIVRINREGTEVLRRHARPTPVGQGLLDELFRWDRHFATVL